MRTIEDIRADLESEKFASSTLREEVALELVNEAFRAGQARLIVVEEPDKMPATEIVIHDRDRSMNYAYRYAAAPSEAELRHEAADGTITRLACITTPVPMEELILDHDGVRYGYQCTGRLADCSHCNDTGEVSGGAYYCKCQAGRDLFRVSMEAEDDELE